MLAAPMPAVRSHQACTWCAGLTSAVQRCQLCPTTALLCWAAEVKTAAQNHLTPADAMFVSTAVMEAPLVPGNARGRGGVGHVLQLR